MLDMNSETDEEIISLILKDDKEYFGIIIDRYTDKLLRYIKRIINVEEEQRYDILQDVFIKTYTNLNNFDDSFKFSSWVYRICHNEVISHYRKAKTKIDNGQVDIDDETLAYFASDIDIMSEIHGAEDKKMINDILDKMSFKYREILILKFLEQKDYGEMSDILQKPSGTIGTLVHRAKKEFIKIFNTENYEK